MKRVLLPAIAGIALASPALAQDRLASPLKTVRAATRSATVEPAASGFVSGAQVQPFHDGMIYQVYAAPGLVTDIILQPGETLVAVASGDTARWVIGDTTKNATAIGHHSTAARVRSADRQAQTAAPANKTTVPSTTAACTRFGSGAARRSSRRRSADTLARYQRPGSPPRPTGSLDREIGRAHV